MEDEESNELIKKENTNKDNAFNKLYNLQLLIKKESYLNESCKIYILIIYKYS